jgi:four helix bundle protein
MKEFRISDLRFRIGFLNLKTFNNMTKEELKNRTKKFALMIIKLVNELPNTKVGNTIGNQLIRSGTSVAANYRASCRARSTADFVSKITIVEEECDESLLWLELIMESDLLRNELLLDIIREANELTAIFTASGKTAKQNNRR